MDTINIIAWYVLCGVLFSVGLEWIMHKTKFELDKPTKNWERIFWVTCWPFLLIKFLIAYHKEENDE